MEDLARRVANQGHQQQGGDPRPPRLMPARAATKDATTATEAYRSDCVCRASARSRALPSSVALPHSYAPPTSSPPSLRGRWRSRPRPTRGTGCRSMSEWIGRRAELRTGRRRSAPQSRGPRGSQSSGGRTGGARRLARPPSATRTAPARSTTRRGSSGAHPSPASGSGQVPVRGLRERDRGVEAGREKEDSSDGGAAFVCQALRRRRRLGVRAVGVFMGTLGGFPNPPAMVRGEQSSPTPHAIRMLFMAREGSLARRGSELPSRNIAVLDRRQLGERLGQRVGGHRPRRW